MVIFRNLLFSFFFLYLFDINCGSSKKRQNENTNLDTNLGSVIELTEKTTTVKDVTHIKKSDLIIPKETSKETSKETPMDNKIDKKEVIEDNKKKEDKSTKKESEIKVKVKGVEGIKIEEVEELDSDYLKIINQTFIQNKNIGGQQNVFVFKTSIEGVQSREQVEKLQIELDSPINNDLAHMLALVFFNGKNYIVFAKDCNSTELENTHNPIVYTGMFQGRGISTITIISTGKVNNFASLFCGCNELVSVDAIELDTTSIGDMSRMFCMCKNLKNVGILEVFKSCKQFISCKEMFRFCSMIKKIEIGFAVDNMSEMFKDCAVLEEINFNLEGIIYNDDENFNAYDIIKNSHNVKKICIYIGNPEILNDFKEILKDGKFAYDESNKIFYKPGV